MDGLLPVEPGLDPVRGPVQHVGPDVAGVAGKIVRLDPDRERIRFPERGPEAREARREPAEHALVPARPEARQPEDRPASGDLRHGADLPAVAHVGQHARAGIERVPVEHGTDLVVGVAASRDELEVPGQLVRGKPTDTFLAEDPPPAGCHAPTGSSLGATGRLHPAAEKRFQIHAAAIVRHGDGPFRCTHAAELDADHRGVGVVRVLHQLGDREDVIADQLRADQLEEPRARPELDEARPRLPRQSPLPCLP